MFNDFATFSYVSQSFGIEEVKEIGFRAGSRKNNRAKCDLSNNHKEIMLLSQEI